MTERTFSSPDASREALAQLRHSLLVLHKALIEFERVEYEGAFGTIRSPNAFLRLLLEDPWFSWLRPLSELMVLIDEAMDAKEEPVTSEVAKRFFDLASTLLQPTEVGTGFGKHYFNAIQREPDVVLAHAEVIRLIGRPPVKDS